MDERNVTKWMNIVAFASFVGICVSGYYNIQRKKEYFAKVTAQFYAAVDTDRDGVLDDAEKRVFAQWVNGNAVEVRSMSRFHEFVLGYKPELSIACDPIAYASEIKNRSALESKLARATFDVVRCTDRKVIVHEPKDKLKAQIPENVAQEYMRDILRDTCRSNYERLHPRDPEPSE